MKDKIMLIGSFYLKQTHSGNLLGEFYNNHNRIRTYTESADLERKNTSDLFVGEYLSTWREENEPVEFNLKIERIESNSYKLTWRNKDRNVFFGYGFIVDNILIGDYTDFEY